MPSLVCLRNTSETSSFQIVRESEILHLTLSPRTALLSLREQLRYGVMGTQSRLGNKGLSVTVRAKPSYADSTLGPENVTDMPQQDASCRPYCHIQQQTGDLWSMLRSRHGMRAIGTQ